jgi:hypothetical protein
MAELNADLVSDVLGVADDNLERLADALVHDPQDALVVDVRGEIGTAVVVSLVVENSRSEIALVRCEPAALDGFALGAEPTTFELAPGASRAVSIRVGLPSTPAMEALEAGTVTIRGQDERDLVVWIRATVEAPAGEIPPDDGQGSAG